MSYAVLIGAALDLVSAKIERDAVIAKVREMEAQGASPTQIADALRAMAVTSESDAQTAINKA